jgi:ribosomal protein S18 acetylase RimI-like enzyme
MRLHIERADLGRDGVAEPYLALMDLFVRGEAAAPSAPGLPDDVRARLVPALQARPDVTLLMAWLGDEAVGFALCIEGFSTFAARPLLNLHDMMVHPAHRRRGVARRLLAAVEARAHELGCCKLTLEVLSGNAGALALYESFGFRGYALDPQRGTALFWEKPLAGL